MKRFFISVCFIFFSFSGFSQIDFQVDTVHSFKDLSFSLSDLVTCDIDNDGDLDVVTISSRFNEISYFENLDGQGKFSFKKVIHQDLSEHFLKNTILYPMDYNKDGFSDILTIIGNDIVLFLNNQNKTFERSTIFSSDFEMIKIFSSDLDGDGKLDMVVGFASGKMKWFEIENGIVSSEGKTVCPSISKSEYYFLDIDNDGDFDVVSSSQIGYNFYWYQNDGDGNFEAKSIYYSNELTNNNSLSIKDINDDGDLDLVFASGGSGEIILFDNDGNGNFRGQTISQFASNTKSFLKIRMTDLDKDGDVDILFSSRDEKAIFWFENIDGNDLFDKKIKLSHQKNIPFVFECKDINGDGYDDIILGSIMLIFAEYNTILWAELIEGIFKQNIINFPLLNHATKSADIDGDGDLDLLSISAVKESTGIVNGAVYWYENNNGFFSSMINVSQNIDYGCSVVSGDIDGDGDLDIVSTDNYKIAWYENENGKGSYGKQKVLNSPSGIPEESIIVDFDGDGDLDICGILRKSYFLFFENMDGKGSFAPSIVVCYCNAMLDDVDSDGDLDLTYQKKDKIVQLINNDGDFIEKTFLELEGETLSGDLELKDIDNDGDLDIMFLGFKNLSWIEIENGLFKNEIIITQDTYLKSSKIIDIDGDNDLDIVTIYDSNKIVWYQNIDGQFGDYAVIDSTDLIYFSLFVDDLDRDGKLDIIVSTTFGLLLYKNLSTVSVEYIKDESVFVSPNPVENILTVKLDEDIKIIELFNSSGELVFVSENTKFVQVSKLLPGIYFCRITDGNGDVYSQKVIKL